MNMVHRIEAPITGILHRSAWEGKYLAFGVVPALPMNAASEQVARFGAMVRRLRLSGDDEDPRPYAQPPQSGTTGEQPDFGASRCEHAIAMSDPWAIWDLRYSAQAWGLRPYANREASGDSVYSFSHPDARTVNRVPHDVHSRADMLGWPNPVGYINGYNGSDTQHRSDNLLYGLFRLTRSYALRDIIADLQELDLMDLTFHRPWPTPGSGVSSPRGWGRMLVSLCHAYDAGVGRRDLLRGQITELVQHMSIAASFRNIASSDPERTVRVLSDNEAKYGWVDAQGKLVRCWLPWQESIACMGLYAAWRAFRQYDAEELCVTVASTIARHAWLPDGRLVYGMAWDDGRPSTNVNIGGMSPSWVLPALQILLHFDPRSEAAEMARARIAQHPLLTWRDSCWRAV